MATWTAEQREVAVGLLRAGTPFADVHRRTGVPKPTLSRWAREADVQPAGAEQVEAAANATKIAWSQRRASLVDDLGEAAVALLEKTLDASDGPDARGWATAVAILVDKAQLLSGGVTSRHEQLDAERRRERVEHLADELEERRRAKDGTTGG